MMSYDDPAICNIVKKKMHASSHASLLAAEATTSQVASAELGTTISSAW